MITLVTGGAGFIGSNLIRHLLAGGVRRVICFDNFDSYYSPEQKRANIAKYARNPAVTVVSGSVTDATFVKQLFDTYGVTHVAHLAAKVGVRASLSDPQGYAKVNVVGTHVLLEAARRHGIERFLLVSSSSVYGRGAELPFVEDRHLGEVMTPYGESKRAAEVLVREYHQQHGVPIVCVRPFSVYGPCMRPDLALSLFIRAIVSRAPVPLIGGGHDRRDFTHVDDVCAGLLLALERPEAIGRAFNLGRGQAVQIREAIILLEEALRLKAVIEDFPREVAEIPVTLADLTNSSRVLGYVPHVSLAEGITSYVQSLMAVKY
jgi:UDP-glucuronate 4-epimerase